MNVSNINVIENVRALGLEIPDVAPPAANYTPFIEHDGLIFISGQIPMISGKTAYLGKVGDDLTIEQGREAARDCALNILGALNRAIEDDWDRVVRCIKLGGFVNCHPDFNDHPKVINGASDLMVAALGDRGVHTRFAVGAASLPLGVAVEVEALFAVK